MSIYDKWLHWHYVNVPESERPTTEQLSEFLNIYMMDYIATKNI